MLARAVRARRGVGTGALGSLCPWGERPAGVAGGAAPRSCPFLFPRARRVLWSLPPAPGRARHVPRVCRACGRAACERASIVFCPERQVGRSHLWGWQLENRTRVLGVWVRLGGVSRPSKSAQARARAPGLVVWEHNGQPGGHRGGRGCGRRPCAVWSGAPGCLLANALALGRRHRRDSHALRDLVSCRLGTRAPRV